MKAFKSILSLSILSSFLFATIGFTVSRHYCMGMVVEESFYIPSHSCSMEEADEHCDNDIDHIKKNCCNDEQVVVPGIEVVNLQSSKTIAFDSYFFIVPKVLALDNIGLIQSDYSHKQYFPPPDDNKDVLILYQRFLI